ncbi:NB-ARC domain-containing protein [Actinoplanes xinjiangensis]|uniref:NB-ARC domain-containing protein n=1 Tax=Actinoplanes xinjiangensis TaxID=512350 RepID=A0A316EVN0_9ACTN|nr:NB-ARC domain-containing protein [Actinoplanes xinjiangensis]GIF42999.1 SARP family transcriptional regulator [Actinoplanes xinjiangensis]
MLHVAGPHERLVSQLAQIKDVSGLSLRALATRAGLSSSSLSRYLTGRLVPPWDAVVALCRAVGRDPRPLRPIWAEADRAGAAPPPRRNDLPADLFDFTGRETEIARAEELLRTAGAVAIDGMAGVGKTSLAVHVAHRAAGAYPDGGLYLDLHGFTPGHEPLAPAVALERLLGALDVTHLPAAVDDRAALWRSELSRRRVLVVLDNAADTAQVRPLLPGAGRSAVLLTSRNRLISLDAVPPLSLTPLDGDDAARLFARAAGLTLRLSGDAPGGPSGGAATGLPADAAARLSRSAADADTGRPSGGAAGLSRPDTGRLAGGAAEDEGVEQVLAQCGGLPLALRMAGARLRHRPGWTVAVLAERLRDGANRFDAAFGMSLRQLDDRQRRVFRLLGVLPGGDFGTDAAVALTGLPRGRCAEVLDELVDAHLLQETSPGRFRMHDLIRQYAADLAAEDEAEAGTAVRRVLRHYLAVAAGAAPDWFDVEYPNLVAAFDTAVRLGDDEVVADLAPAMRVWFFRHRGTADHVRLLEKAADAAGRLGRDRQRASLLADLGFAHAAAGRLTEALDAYEAAAALADLAPPLTPAASANTAASASPAVFVKSAVAAGPDGAGRPKEDAAAEGELAAALALRTGFVLRDLSRYPEARERFQQARALFAATGNRGGESQALAFDGWVALRLGHRDDAAGLARAALDLAEGPARITGLITLGRATGSLPTLEEALRLAGEHRLPHQQAWCHNQIGLALRESGDFPAALDHHRRALVLLETLAEVQLEIECRRDHDETVRLATEAARTPAARDGPAAEDGPAAKDGPAAEEQQSAANGRPTGGRARPVESGLEG